ncbi:MAG: DinB family protein [Zavarzinella sp.]
MIDYFQRLFRYAAWANRRICATLRATPEALPDGGPLFSHVLAAEEVWLSRLLQRPSLLQVWPTLTLDECEQWIVNNENGYQEYLSSITNEQLSNTLNFRNFAGQEFVHPIADILTHVVTHGGYHRGQVAKITGRSGGTTPSTDFIMFVREGF